MPKTRARSKRRTSGKPVAASRRKAAATAGDQDKGKKLLLNFRRSDGLFGVTRSTMRKLAAELNLNETQVVHVALRRLADSVLPAYEADDGPLSAAQLAAIRRLAGRQEVHSISSTLL